MSGKKGFGKVNAVIKETLDGSVLSKYHLSASEALESGMKFIGPNYKQIGKTNSGVFRSADGLRGFRIDTNSIKGLHNPNVPHYHLEVFKPSTNKPYI